MAIRYYSLTRQDGGVEIMQVINDNKTPQDCIAKWPVSRQAEILSIREISLSDVPSDRYFRNAWKDTGIGKLSVDMPKARSIHREKLRELRDPRLVILDASYLKADEEGNLLEKQRIANKKQQLRNALQDPRIDAAATPEELKGVIPTVLTE